VGNFEARLLREEELRERSIHDEELAQMRERAEAEATVRRYGGRCAHCGVLRDYHGRKFTVNLTHEFVRASIDERSV